MRNYVLITFLVVVLAGGLFVLLRPSEVAISPNGEIEAAESSGDEPTENIGNEANENLEDEKVLSGISSGDLPPQPQLSNPPDVAKAIYISGWSAGTPSRIKALIDLVGRTELNAVVIDIKDYSGHLSYVTDIEEAEDAGAHKEPRISRPNALIKELHDNDIYVIGRITVFQDPIFAKANPSIAMRDNVTGGLWEDNKGIEWLDPAAKSAWDYHVAIAKDALGRGFDEINFDYIRFASDGPLSRADWPVWDEVSPKHLTIKKFFEYLRSELRGAQISADLFGLATVNKDDLGIGQIIEDAYLNFDYVAPMVYPSHYAKGFIGYQNPGAHPYEVMKYSLDRAWERREALINPASTSTPAIPREKVGKLRPWIQDFDLGATYTAEMVRSEFKAVYDSLIRGTGTSTDAYAGWYVWDPSNTYTEGALERR